MVCIPFFLCFSNGCSFPLEQGKQNVTFFFGRNISAIFDEHSVIFCFNEFKGIRLTKWNGKHFNQVYGVEKLKKACHALENSVRWLERWKGE